VQEQLNNILKYANAKKILVDLSQSKTSVNLVISENGIGFDTAKKQKGKVVKFKITGIFIQGSPICISYSTRPPL
jgi:signal transduction histidine kinase